MGNEITESSIETFAIYLLEKEGYQYKYRLNTTTDIGGRVRIITV
jgi:hypothetical protein